MERIQKPLQMGAGIYVYGGDAPDYPMVSTTAAGARWGLHAKTMVIDGVHSLISSYNLDPRSEHWNHELALACFDQPALANYILSDIQTRMTKSSRLNENGLPTDHRYPSNKSPFVLKAGLLFFSPVIILLEELL
jgi:phosphatidylserine/phosphatidylglycerophosphate/cardiolipin synthase-like enzyme